MKKLVGVAAAVIVIVAAVVFLYTRPGSTPVRGAWVTGFGTGYMTPEQVDRTIAAAQKAHLNLLMVEVRKSADAYYDSGLEPKADDVAPRFDPLAYTLKKAHAKGIKIHAWVSVFRVWRGSGRPSDPQHLANRHPDWVSRSYAEKLNAADGLFVDPGVPEAVDYTVRVITDIVQRYDVDGLHLDFIRYPDGKWGYAPAATKRFQTETGHSHKPLPDDPMWQQWRRDQVTQAVRKIRQAVTRVKPGLLISAATITYGTCSEMFPDTSAYRELGQNWPEWLSNDLIDANVPMNYRDTRNPQKMDEFRDWLPAFRKWSCGKPVFVGVAAYLSDTESVSRQVDEIRRHGLDGYMVFCFNESGIRVENRDRLAAGLAASDSRWKKWRGDCGRFLDSH